MLNYPIFDRSGYPLFTAKIDCDESESDAMKKRLAVFWAIKNNVSLSGADLSGADLTNANLSYAYLRYANLSRADLSGANLSYANLSGASFSGADLYNANLSYANLSNAIFLKTNFDDAINTEESVKATRVVPEGDIEGWKKCKNGVIVKLRIPAAARRSNAFGRKCRAEYVQVLEVIGSDVGVSFHDDKTLYHAGKTVKPDKWCDKFWEECSSGIHFFLTREEAEEY